MSDYIHSKHTTETIFIGKCEILPDGCSERVATKYNLKVK